MTSIVLTTLQPGVIRLHLSTLLLLFPIFLASNKVSVVAMLIGWSLIIFAQLYGQLFVARIRRLSGIEFFITPLATITVYRQSPHVYERALVAWGGIGGQAFLAGASVILMIILPLDKIEASYKNWLDVFYVTIFCNLLFILVSFNRRPPFPGAIIWCVFRKSARSKTDVERRAQPPSQERHTMTDDGDFIH